MLTSVKNDKYILKNKIGEGAFSEVFKAKKDPTRELVAAKRLTRYFVNIEEVEDYTELKVLRKLTSHDNVATIIDYIFQDNCLILLFELMDFSLYDFIKDRKKKLSETRCKNYLFQLGQGLMYLHTNEIFHRDLKPENCLLRINPELLKSNPTQAEIIQIADLGSATFTQYPFPRSPYISTRWYRSPEIILAPGYYGPKMDIWALGCVFYEMLTFHPLFPGINDSDQLEKIHRILGKPSKYMLTRFKKMNYECDFEDKRPVDLYKILPMLSTNGIEILKRTLAYHPDNRITAKKLLEHVYFDDLRNRFEKKLSLKGMLCTKSDTTSTAKSKKLKSSFSNVSSISGFDIVQQQLSKYELERNWNNPKGSFKKSFIKNFESSIVGSD
ncbi:unnamed protein product [Chironomus riparius]|uniref:Protein kinase domain-containing protein n=1 Tax=Chironomus riparius TaxID=315576 RepID=A0A9N9WR87_9DIPT|nr:unnamed protein product [Chironomus riparius]